MGSSSHQQLYSLSWADYGSSLTSAVQLLRGEDDLVDVTITAGKRSFYAHKIVLSAASPFLCELFKSTTCQHPVVILSGIAADDLETILEFVYRGEVNVEQSQLPSLLQAAQCLSIHGLPHTLTVMSQKGEENPISSMQGCNDPSVARDTMNSYLAQRRRKKKRKQDIGGGKWPRYSIDPRDSDDHRVLNYGHKDHDDSHDEGKGRGEQQHANHHIGSPLPQHQLVHPVNEHNAALIAEPEAEPHLHNLMPMQPYSPLHIPQFPGAIQSMSAYSAASSMAASAASVSAPSGASTPANSVSTASTGRESSTGAKIRGASDCPGVCPLCGATLRQARNLRRHLLSSCKYRFSANNSSSSSGGGGGGGGGGHGGHMSDSMSVEVKPEVNIPGYPSQSVVCGGAGGSGSTASSASSCEQIVCNPSPLPSPSPQGDWASKSRTLSDQPATCPLCGAVIRQSRNLRRHLELLHFGAGAGGSGGKSGTRHSKKERHDKGSAGSSSSSRSSGFGKSSKANAAAAAAGPTNYSTMPGLALSSGANAASINVPGHHGHHHHHHHHHGGPAAHGLTSASHPASAMPTPGNGLYSSEHGASMLSCLLPQLPTLPTLSNPHDVFRHSEFLRANMAYPQERQQHANRHLQRTDVT